MATAKKTTKQIPYRPPVVMQEYPTYTLELTGTEAHTLCDVIANIGGSMNTRRAHMASIGSALEKVGIIWDVDSEDLGGELMFLMEEGA